ncbi:hypothetical protein EV126DRAFT_183647 [Verticillium dahliae]|nr:hypothetical protein EV126DRAFT_183647 [Verticillium dahliae]
MTNMVWRLETRRRRASATGGAAASSCSCSCSCHWQTPSSSISSIPKLLNSVDSVDDLCCAIKQAMCSDHAIPPRSRLGLLPTPVTGSYQLPVTITSPTSPCHPHHGERYTPAFDIAKKSFAFKLPYLDGSSPGWTDATHNRSRTISECHGAIL